MGIAKIYCLISTKMDPRSDMGYIRSFKHNAELHETRLTVKNGVIQTSETYVLLDFDENWHKCIKDMPAPKKKYKREARRSEAERSEAERSGAERSEANVYYV